MKAFHFPLEKALDWRRIQLELEEVRYKQQVGALSGLDRQRAEVEASGIRAEIQVREWCPIEARDLTALGNFRPVRQVAGVRDRPPPLRSRPKAGRTAKGHARSTPPLPPPGAPEGTPLDRVDRHPGPRGRGDRRRQLPRPLGKTQTGGIGLCAFLRVLRTSAVNPVPPQPSPPYNGYMVRPERRVVLAGESPVRVSAGAPGRRLQPNGEIRPRRAESRKPLKERGANQRAATTGERCKPRHSISRIEHGNGRRARHVKKIVVKPCAGKPQAQFERGLMDTGRR